ncbi:MAG: hypothetical protein ABIZ56_08770 [Chthoniobacteraceae bacterium]
MSDATAPQAFVAVAQNPALWDTLYFSNLVATNLLRLEDQPPPLVAQPVLASFQAILAGGLLDGELG